MAPERGSAPVGQTEARGKQQPEAWSSKDTKPPADLQERIEQLRQCALQHRMKADSTTGDESERALSSWIDVRMEIARLLARMSKGRI